VSVGREISVTVQVDTETTLGSASAQGGTIDVTYDAGAGELVIDDG